MMFTLCKTYEVYNVLHQNCACEMYVGKHTSHHNNYAHRSQIDEKNHTFLHLFHTTPYNLLNVKQQSFTLILYERSQTYYTK